MAKVFIGIGSNIDPEANLSAAAQLLRLEWPDIRFSSVYRSKAREVEEQEDFLNAVAMIETEQTPEEVHGRLKDIENKLGKEPPYRFGPRTIDFDILIYEDITRDTETLTIPHPRMHERRFVLEPLCELIDSEKWKEWLEKTRDQECVQTNIAL